MLTAKLRDSNLKGTVFDQLLKALIFVLIFILTRIQSIFSRLTLAYIASRSSLESAQCSREFLLFQSIPNGLDY